MSKVDQIAEIAADGVADGMHLVSDEALAVEQVVQAIDKFRIAYVGLGVAIGGVIGGLLAYKLAYTRAEAKYNEIAAQEVADMRDHFNAKIVAREAEGDKPSLADLVRENGYGDGEEPLADSAPPMAVSAPDSVVEAAREAAGERSEDPRGEPEVQNVFKQTQVDYAWDEHAERRKRSPNRPYVIHVDARDDHDAYEDVTYTYYEKDDVLTNEREEIMNAEDREQVVGEANLERFGHGSDNNDLVYVRNPKLEMDIEIIKSNGSYSEEVHGFIPEPEDETRSRGRSSPDDE